MEDKEEGRKRCGNRNGKGRWTGMEGVKKCRRIRVEIDTD
jgi:hypothetical protein